MREREIGFLRKWRELAKAAEYLGAPIPTLGEARRYLGYAMIYPYQHRAIRALISNPIVTVTAKRPPIDRTLYDALFYSSDNCRSIEREPD
jgi:hypothetical protein